MNHNLNQLIKSAIRRKRIFRDIGGNREMLIVSYKERHSEAALIQFIHDKITHHITDALADPLNHISKFTRKKITAHYHEP